MFTPKFFTLPPCPYPFVIINLNKPNLTYIRKNRKHIREVIIDSGIEIFRKRDIIDYPNGFIERLHSALHLRDKIRSIAKTKIYVTIPDYCDDYHHRGLWLDDYDNIFRTLDSIFYAFDECYYKFYFVPIQGYMNTPNSIEKCIEYLDYYGVLKKHNYFALANLCVARKTDILVKTICIARKYIKKYLHVFGLTLRVLPKICKLIDSFDSFAWTRPVNNKLLNANWSCKNNEERKKFFVTWLKRYKEIIRRKNSITPIENFL